MIKINFRTLLLATTLGCLGLSASDGHAEMLDMGHLGIQKDPFVKLVRWHRPQHNNISYPIMVNGWWGLMNQHGHVIAYPEFDWVDYSTSGFIRAVRDGKTGYIKGDGSWHIPNTYTYADRFVENYAVVSEDGKKFGLMGLDGKLTVPMEFDKILRMKDGYAAVEKDGLCGFVDLSGKLVIPLRYKQVRSFHQYYAAVQFQDGHWGYIDIRGNTKWEDKSGRVTELGDFEGASKQSPGPSFAKIKVKVKDRQGKVVEKWGFLDLRFKLAIDPIYDDVRDFTSGCAAAKTEAGWGYILPNGKASVPFGFDEADDIDSAWGLVKKDGLYGYIDIAGKSGIKPIFEFSEPYYRNYARVSRGNSFAYIDTSGRVIFDPVACKPGFKVQDITRSQLNARDLQVRNQYVPPPPERKPIPTKYKPEHKYEEVLPERK